VGRAVLWYNYTDQLGLDVPSKQKQRKQPPKRGFANGLHCGMIWRSSWQVALWVAQFRGTQRWNMTEEPGIPTKMPKIAPKKNLITKLRIIVVQLWVYTLLPNLPKKYYSHLLTKFQNMPRCASTVSLPPLSLSIFLCEERGIPPSYGSLKSS
jgi:hypothetical protein